jgi:hypothetical protein
MVTVVHKNKLSVRLAFGVMTVAQLAALATAACQSSERTEEVGAATSQVKPASARAPSEAEPLAEPEHEAADLPRGVSPPQSEARVPGDGSKASSASPAKPSTPSAATKPAASVTNAKPTVVAQTSSKPKAEVSAPSVPKKPAPAAPKPPPPAPPPPVPAEPIAAPPPAPAPAPKKVSVNVPQTDHVRVEVPPGLQHWLDEDDRMRPWLGKAINVADSCYAKVRADEPNASGEIAFVVTMHKNARPSGKVSSVSSPISGIVMCATTRLLGVKMPLFTGDEGASYTVRVRFTP